MFLLIHLIPVHVSRRHADGRMARRAADGIVVDGHGKISGVRMDDQTAWLYASPPKGIMYRVLDHEGRALLASPGATDGVRGAERRPREDVGRTGTRALADNCSICRRSSATRGRDRLRPDAISHPSDRGLVALKFEPMPEFTTFTLLAAIDAFSIALRFVMRRLLDPVGQASAEAAQVSTSHPCGRLSALSVPAALGRADSPVQSGYRASGA
ncbi:hypothetical protein QCE63_00275 [Caballeronia sp. LZ065]|uniref:hypothetical protein n=1 Tax=Caballeronia sp. LZ065 TaxID=3038571 RepID=UPI0028558D5D|nr:hypothetical protein [Caballeronia sp. LZ065]MDR5777861.1 hypothetical protein [Caballeronia sp. LZ065]